MYCECGCGRKLLGERYYDYGRKKARNPRFALGHQARVEHPRGNAKLDEFDVRRIKKIIAKRRKLRGRPRKSMSYISNEHIAREFRVRKETISAISRGLTWKNVPWPHEEESRVA